jgi:hypothetical protein
MKTRLLASLAAGALVVLPMTAFAHGHGGNSGATHHFSQRLEQQQDRIGHGVADGQLTPKEADRLEHNENSLEHKLKQDGNLSHHEAEQLNKAFDHEGADIRDLKTNGHEDALTDRHSHLAGRFDRQQDRIAQGIESGQLTPKEAIKLENDEHQFKHADLKHAPNGISGHERRRLEKELNQDGNQIDQLKHNGQTL